MSSTNYNPIQLAIVSPCSQCQNQLSEVQPGLPPCPRRLLQKRKDELEAAGASTRHLDHLVLTGQEALPEASGDGTSVNNDLRNPVYWNDGHATLVWVAFLADNGGRYDAAGQLITPHLLDPSFDTTYIQCHQLPVVPASAEAAYFTLGAFSEGDQVEVRLSTNQQMDLNSENDDVVLIDGFAQKVQFAFYVSRNPVPKDTVPAGI